MRTFSLISNTGLQPPLGQLNGGVIRTLSTFFVLGIAVSLCDAQWFQQNPLPTGNSLSSVSMIDSNTATAVGANGTIIRTTNGGTTWTNQVSGTTAPLFGVCFTDVNQGTAVGGTNYFQGGGGAQMMRSLRSYSVLQTSVEDHSVILHTSDGGGTWVRQFSGASKALFDICFIDRDRGIAVGDGGTILRTTDGGTTWAQQTRGDTVCLRGVSFTDVNTGTAVGWSPGQGKWGGPHMFILRTIDGGANWTEQASPAAWPLRDVSFTSTTTGTAVGDDSTIIHTTDGGITWRSQSTGGIGIYATGVCFIDSSHGTVVGWPYSGGPGIVLQTSDAGMTWISRATGTMFPLNSVSFSNSRNGMIVGELGIMYRTSDSGSTWINLSPGTRADLQAVSLVNSTTGFVVTRDGTIFRTVDGGVSWNPVFGRQSSWFHGVCVVDAMHCVAVGWEYQGPQGWTMNGIVVRTTDGGMSWKDNLILSDTLFNAVHFADSNTGTIVGYKLFGEGVVLHTTNGGTTWCRQSFGTTAASNGVFFTDAYTGTAVGGGGAIARTTNGGNTWITQRSQPMEDLVGVSFTDAVNGTVVGTKYDSLWQASALILRTTNGGADWTPQYAAGGESRLSSVAFTDVNNGTAVGDATLLHTTDGGITWTPQLAGRQWPLWSVSFSDANTGTAVGYNGTILRTTTAGVTWVPDPPVASLKIPDDFTLSQNYPNPFNPSTAISYQLPTQSHVVLKVYDVLGREVMTLVDQVEEPGNRSVNLHAQRLASGVYYYRITAVQTDGGQAGTPSTVRQAHGSGQLFTETKKLLLLR